MHSLHQDTVIQLSDHDIACHTLRRGWLELFCGTDGTGWKDKQTKESSIPLSITIVAVCSWAVCGGRLIFGWSANNDFTWEMFRRHPPLTTEMWWKMSRRCMIRLHSGGGVCGFCNCDTHFQHSSSSLPYPPFNTPQPWWQTVAWEWG